MEQLESNWTYDLFIHKFIHLIQTLIKWLGTMLCQLFRIQSCMKRFCCEAYVVLCINKMCGKWDESVGENKRKIKASGKDCLFSFQGILKILKKLFKNSSHTKNVSLVKIEEAIRLFFCVCVFNICIFNHIYDMICIYAVYTCICISLCVHIHS